MGTGVVVGAVTLGGHRAGGGCHHPGVPTGGQGGPWVPPPCGGHEVTRGSWVVGAVTLGCPWGDKGGSRCHHRGVPMAGTGLVLRPWVPSPRGALGLAVGWCVPAPWGARGGTRVAAGATLECPWWGQGWQGVPPPMGTGLGGGCHRPRVSMVGGQGRRCAHGCCHPGVPMGGTGVAVGAVTHGGVGGGIGLPLPLPRWRRSAHPPSRAVAP